MDNTKSPTVLGTEPIGKLLIKYSVPAVIAMTATSLYNIIDSIFIGRGVGPLAIAGLAVTFPLMNLVIAFCTLIATGGATICSIFLGQKDLKATQETLNSVVVLCVIHSVIFGGITLLFLRPILLFFGATAATVEYAVEFMQVILAATPITYIFIGLNNVMRATGYPRKAMISALLSVLFNLIFAPIFIFILDWGIKGAAFATLISQSIALIWVLYHFYNKKSFIHFEKGIRFFNKKIIGHIYSIGLSPFMINVCACIVVIFINKALLYTSGTDGNMAIGAYGIINRTAMMLFMIVFGVTQGMQPILGYNYGANNFDRVNRTLRIGMAIGFIITTLGWIVCEFSPQIISQLFTTDNTLIDIANNGFKLVFLFWPLVGVAIVIQNFFQSIGMPKISIFLSLTRQLIFLVPFLLFLPHIFGTNGVWWSMAIADILSFSITILTLIYQKKKLNKIHNSLSD